jgi:hypothetical protein
LLAAVGVVVALAACGSSGRSSSTSGGPSVQAENQAALTFSHCMRSHGVSNFPDPSSPHQFKFALDPSSGNTRSPVFQAALTACHHLLPGGGPHAESAASRQARVTAALAFARCLRSHGFPTFPDPTSSGELTPQMAAQAGINLHQPAVLRDADACVSVTHGFITKADVARAVNSANAAGQ